MRLFGLAFAMMMFLSPAIAFAEQAKNLGGAWALRADDKTLMVLQLQQAKDGSWTGTLTGPSSFQLASAGPIFTDVRGPAKTRRLLKAKAQPEQLELEMGTSKDDATIFVWRLGETGEAELKFRDFPGPSLPFIPARPSEAVSKDLDPDRAYVAYRPTLPNAEMIAIFEADQAARENPSAIDRAVVNKEDEKRLARTRALLEAGKLRNGADFLRAAFIFQHSSNSSDYLLAHTLAQIAMARGRPDAAWIGAASLDRYLQSIGQKQIYGTQFRSDSNGKLTQEPFDRALISSSLRQALGVTPAN